MNKTLALGFAAMALCPTTVFAQLFSTDLLVLQPELGVAYADIAAFKSNMLLPGLSVPGAVESKGFGAHFGVLAGMRFGPIAFGLHADLSRLPGFDIGTLGPQLQIRLPIPVIQPFARINLGYAWMGAIDSASVWMCSPSGAGGSTCPSISGWTLSGGGGVDLWLSRHITLGGAIDFYLLNFNRSASPTTVNFTQEGSAVGLQLTAKVQAALRF